MAVELAQEIDISLLQPHPRNVEIYGEEDVAELVDYIRDSKWIKPLVISQHNRIISGHRRWQAAKALGLTRVPYVKQVFETETHELMALLLENASRDKNPAQKVHEADTWKEIEDNEAWERQASGGGDKYNTEPLRENFPYPQTNGRTRDKLAERVGFGSGKTYEAAAKVVRTADQLKDEGKAEEGQALLKVLNEQSVNAATRVLSMPEPQKESVLQTIASGKASTVKQAEAVIKQEAPPSEVDEEDDDDLMKITEKEKRGVPAALLTSKSNEWFTPPEYVEKARELMRGIDVDPASNAYANKKVVQATAYYDIQTNGLDKEWYGRVWLNPPYGRDEEGSNQEAWSHRLIEQFESGNTKEAVLLVNANTEAKWFQPLYDYTICFTNHRIRFYNTEGTPSQPTQGNAFIYFGNQQERFVELFSAFGVVIRRIDK